MNLELAKEIALRLLEINAIKLKPNEPFTWASGWKSPIYCDNRLSLSYPELRTYIKDNLVKTISENFQDVEAIAGVATAGIPQGVLIAEAMDLPFIYVRSKPKGHGLSNQIEGKVVDSQRVIVVEDLISTGGSSINAVNALRKAKLNVLGMVAIFTYQFPVSEVNLKSERITTFTLSNYTALLDIALEKQLIKSSEVELLKEWRKSPDTWGR